MRALLLGIALALVSHHLCSSEKVTCLDDQGKPVPFWFSHKWKGSHITTFDGEVTGNGYELEMTKADVPFRSSWSYFDPSVKKYVYQPQKERKIAVCEAQGCKALSNTLTNITGAAYWFSFNDQPGACAPQAHEKFFFALNTDSEATILHISVPRMVDYKDGDLPAGKTEKSGGGHRNGQSFLCVNIPANDTGRFLRRIYSIEPYLQKAESANDEPIVAKHPSEEEMVRDYMEGLSTGKKDPILLKGSHDMQVLTHEFFDQAGVTVDFLFKRTNYNEKKKPIKNGDIWVLTQEKLRDLRGLGTIVVSTWEGTANTPNVVDAQCVHPELRGGSYTDKACRRPNRNDHSKIGYSKAVPLIMQSGNNRRETQHDRGGMMIVLSGDPIKPLWEGLKATHTEDACPKTCPDEEDSSPEEDEENEECDSLAQQQFAQEVQAD